MTQPPNPFGNNPFGAPTPPGPPIYNAPPSGHPPLTNTEPANTLATLSVIFAVALAPAGLLLGHLGLPLSANTEVVLAAIFVVVFAPAGAVLGHLGLSQIKRTGQSGRRRALVGIVVSYTLIALAVLALVLSLLSKPTTTCCTPPAATAPAVDLSRLIPNIQELKDLTRSADLVPQPSTTSLAAPAGAITPAECQASFSITNPNVVDPHAVRGVYRIDYHGDGAVYGAPQPFTLQLSVIAYPDGAAARHIATALQDCTEHRPATASGLDDGNGSSHPFSVASAQAEPHDIASQMSMGADSDNDIVERAVAATSTIVIDLLSISKKLPHADLPPIVNAIQAKISG